MLPELGELCRLEPEPPAPGDGGRGRLFEGEPGLELEPPGLRRCLFEPEPEPEPGLPLWGFAGFAADMGGRFEIVVTLVHEPLAPIFAIPTLAGVVSLKLA